MASLAKGKPGESWNPRQCLASMDAQERKAVPLALEQYRQKLRPLKEVEPDGRGDQSQSVARAFKPIGGKMRPDMSPEQGAAWSASIVVAFSDFPAWIICQAMAKAVHVSYGFPTDMEAGVRSFAKALMEDHWRCLSRIREMADELERAANPKPALEAPEEDRPFYQSEIDDLAKMTSDMRGYLVKLAIRKGWMTQEQYDEARARLFPELQPE